MCEKQHALEGPMRRIVHPTPHSARHLAVFTRHQPASTAACHRHAAAHRRIDSFSPRYLTTCVTRAALAYTVVAASSDSRRHVLEWTSCLIQGMSPGAPPRSASNASILRIEPDMKRDISGLHSILVGCLSRAHGTGATLSHLCRQASLDYVHLLPT